MLVTPDSTIRSMQDITKKYNWIDATVENFFIKSLCSSIQCQGFHRALSLLLTHDAATISRDDPHIAWASALQPEDEDSFSFLSAVRWCSSTLKVSVEGDLCSREGFQSLFIGERIVHRKTSLMIMFKYHQKSILHILLCNTDTVSEGWL